MTEFSRLLRYLKPYRIIFAISVVLMIATGLLEGGTILLLQPIFDIISGGHSGGGMFARLPFGGHRSSSDRGSAGRPDAGEGRSRIFLVIFHEPYRPECDRRRPLVALRSYHAPGRAVLLQASDERVDRSSDERRRAGRTRRFRHSARSAARNGQPDRLPGAALLLQLVAGVGDIAAGAASGLSSDQFQPAAALLHQFQAAERRRDAGRGAGSDFVAARRQGFRDGRLRERALSRLGPQTNA